MLEDTDTDDMLISSMISSSKKNNKCFIGYIDDNCYKIKPLHEMLPKMRAYVKKLWW